MELSVEEYIKILQSCLSKDLLKKKYKENYDDVHITTGHCYIASEAIYHTFGGKEKWSAYTGRDHENGTHWWLKNKETGEIVDPTKEQYTSKFLQPPHDKGKPCAFLTRHPSQRAQKLIDRINLKIEEYQELKKIEIPTPSSKKLIKVK